MSCILFRMEQKQKAPNEWRQSTTFVAKSKYISTPECSMKNRELFITKNVSREKKRNIWIQLKNEQNTFTVLTWSLCVCACGASARANSALCNKTNLLYSFMCLAHLLYSSVQFIFEAHWREVSDADLSLFHVNPKQQQHVLFGRFFGHTAQFCRLWKLNKCVVILRVKIEIVFSLSRCLWMHSVHDNELWVSVCAWTLTVWDIVWQHKDYRIPRRCQCIIMFSIKNMRLFFITFNGENVREEMLTILMYLFLTHSNLTSTK